MSSHTHLLVYSRCKLHFFLNILSTSALELICNCCFLIFSHLLVLCLCHPNSFSPSFCSSVYSVNILSFTAFASIFHSPLNSVAFVIDLLDTPLHLYTCTDLHYCRRWPQLVYQQLVDWHHGIFQMKVKSIFTLSAGFFLASQRKSWWSSATPTVMCIIQCDLCLFAVLHKPFCLSCLLIQMFR